MHFIDVTLLSQTNKQCVCLLCCCIPQYRPSQHTAVQFNVTDCTTSHTQCNNSGERQSAVTNCDWLTSASWRNPQNSDCGTAVQDVLRLSYMMLVYCNDYIPIPNQMYPIHTHTPMLLSHWQIHPPLCLVSSPFTTNFTVHISSNHACYISGPLIHLSTSRALKSVLNIRRVKGSNQQIFVKFSFSSCILCPEIHHTYSGLSRAMYSKTQISIQY
jgi:hypothetical protein